MEEYGIYSRLGIIPESWVRLQTFAIHIHKQPEMEQLNAGHTNICTVGESNHRHAARSATALSVPSRWAIHVKKNVVVMACWSSG